MKNCFLMLNVKQKHSQNENMKYKNLVSMGNADLHRNCIKLFCKEMASYKMIVSYIYKFRFYFTAYVHYSKTTSMKPAT